MATKGDSSAHAYIIKGIYAYKLGKYDEAIKCYDMAIAQEPETEIAEAGWAGKELVFCKQGKSYEALSCYCKLKKIDRNTNLIENSKYKLLNLTSGPAKASLFGGFIDDNALIFALEGAGEGLIDEGLSSVAVSGAGTAAVLSDPLFIAGGIIVIGVIAYENREEIQNCIEGIFSETNSTQTKEPLINI